MSSVKSSDPRPGREVGILHLKKDFELSWNFQTSEKKGDPRDNKTSERKNQRKRKRGQNKNRKLKDLGLAPRVPQSEKLCSIIAKGDICPHKEDCKFSHDVLAYWKSREKDVSDKCLLFEKHGTCPFGIKCLSSSVHTKFGEDGVPRQIKAVDGKPPLVKLNEISSDLKTALRKRKYVFDREFLGMGEAEPRKVDFSNKVYVAPLTTVGNLPYRRILKEFGTDITCGEMAMARNLLQAKPSEWSLVRKHESEDIFGVQLADSDPEILGKCVAMLAKECKVDFIDLNCGCPIDLVTDHGAGSALMNRAKKLGEIVSKMTEATRGHLPIGIKMRMGWNSNKPNAHKFIPLIQQWRNEFKYGEAIAYVSIHGRSRQQRYTKVANWDYIHKCCARASGAVYSNPAKFKPVPVFGNGDILSYTDWEKQMNRQTEWISYLAELEEDEARKLAGANDRDGTNFQAPDHEGRKSPEELGMNTTSRLTTCMLARGALLKPWLSTEIKEKRHWDISSSERLDMLKRFANYGLEHWGSDRRGIDTTRRFLLEWMSFLHRYIPVGLIESQYIPQHINDRPPRFQGRNELETLMGSTAVSDWVKISEMLLGPVCEGYSFQPKHKANSYEVPSEDIIKSLTAT